MNMFPHTGLKTLAKSIQEDMLGIEARSMIDCHYTSENDHRRRVFEPGLWRSS